MARQADPSTGDIDRIVGEALRRHRQKLKLSQADVARVLGVSSKTWSRHEAGVRISFVRLARFSDAYGFPMESLYARLPLWNDALRRPEPRPLPGVGEEASRFTPWPAQDDLQDLIERLSDSERQVVLSALRGIVGKL